MARSWRCGQPIVVARSPKRRKYSRRGRSAGAQVDSRRGDRAAPSSAEGSERHAGESGRMSTVQVLSGTLDDERRREHVYAGDILVFKGVPPLGELCACADALIRAAFGHPDPVRAQFELDREDYVARVASLQKQFRTHPDAKRLCSAALRSVGVDVQRTCWDWLYLRVLPHGERHT